jgi:hypothetical protein
VAVLKIWNYSNTVNGGLFQGAKGCEVYWRGRLAWKGEIARSTGDLRLGDLECTEVHVDGKASDSAHTTHTHHSRNSPFDQQQLVQESQRATKLPERHVPAAGRRRANGRRASMPGMPPRVSQGTKSHPELPSRVATGAARRMIHASGSVRHLKKLPPRHGRRAAQSNPASRDASPTTHARRLFSVQQQQQPSSGESTSNEGSPALGSTGLFSIDGRRRSTGRRSLTKPINLSELTAELESQDDTHKQEQQQQLVQLQAERKKAEQAETRYRAADSVDMSLDTLDFFQQTHRGRMGAHTHKGGHARTHVTPSHSSGSGMLLKNEGVQEHVPVSRAIAHTHTHAHPTPSVSPTVTSQQSKQTPMVSSHALKPSAHASGDAKESAFVIPSLPRGRRYVCVCVCVCV